MLYFGTASMVNYIVDADIVVFNLSSLIQAEQINILPPFAIQYDEVTFDMNYYNYIFNNNFVFLEFMKMIINIYSGNNVYIAIGDYDVHWFLAESLQKIIQERYGIISFIIREMEDLECVLEESNIYGFSEEGIINFDNDRMRFLQLTSKM